MIIKQILLIFIKHNIKGFTQHKFHYYAIFKIIINFKKLNFWHLLKDVKFILGINVYK